MIKNESKINKNLKEYDIWQTQISITQKPIPFSPDPSFSDLDYQGPEKLRSFLYDPFGVNVDLPYTFGLELTASTSLKWTFFTTHLFEKEALKDGYAWLSNLKSKFIGLDGEVKAVLVSKHVLKKQHSLILSEIVIPKGLISYRINILDKFVNLFYNKGNTKVHLYLFWRRETPDTLNRQPDLYNLRTFIGYDIDGLSDNDITKLEGKIQDLFIDIENFHGDRAEIIRNPSISWYDIATCRVFFRDETYWSYSKRVLNFDFPENIPFMQLPILEDENVSYNHINDEYIQKSFTTGRHIQNGVITSTDLYIPLDYLPENMAIFGNPGTGKTTYLANSIKEIQRKTKKKVGILILGCEKEIQEKYYDCDRIIRFYDRRFQVPYWTPGKDARQSIQEMATYLCASMGLKNNVERIIFGVGIEIYEKYNGLPRDLKKFLILIRDYIIAHPYAKELQTNLLQALNHRIKLYEDSYLRYVFQLIQGPPKWLRQWLSGETIFLDIHLCDKFSKILIVNAIFQLIKAYMSDELEQKLKYIIVIDEAHSIFQKPDTLNPDDDEFIQKIQFKKVASKYFGESRAKGLCLIIADQTPTDLFSAVVSLPRIKIIFGLSTPYNKCVSENPNEQTLVRNLKKGFALVISGPTAEKYLVKTRELPKLHFKNKEYKNEQEQRYEENKDIILKNILDDENFLIFDDKRISCYAWNFLRRKYSEFKNNNMIKSAYKLAYALNFYRINIVVSPLFKLYAKDSWSIFDYVDQIYEFTLKEKISPFNEEIFVEFNNISEMHKNFMSGEGVKEKLLFVQKVFDETFKEICRVLNSYSIKENKETCPN